ncbi:MAG: hypothetical protein HKN17_02060 [Rhodothermales bacterium]|nr:hypothetical protein [Rhodothermales bacterium]
MKRILTAATVLFFLAGCDSGDTSAEDTSRKFSVRYEASGTFLQPCNIIYIARKSTVSADQENEGGQGFNLPSTLPWSYAFDVTVTERRPFNLYIGAVCGGGSATDMVEVRLFVDGVLRDSAQETDGVASPEAELQLTVAD